MPSYEYECPKCKKHIELTRTIADHCAAKPVCAEEGCDGNTTMETVIGSSLVQFKGQGWTPKYAPSKPRKFRID